MEFTFDHTIYILGILLGVGFTLIGVWFTEYLKDKHEKIRLTKAFKTEALANLQKANFNLGLLNDPIEEHKGARHAFYTQAYEQLKLNILLDWTKSELASYIFNGYIFAEEYNKRMYKPKLYEKEMGSEKVILDQIKKNMFSIDQSLKNCKNIEAILKEDKDC